MKQIITILITFILLYGVYLESGLCTSICIGLCFYGIGTHEKQIGLMLEMIETIVISIGNIGKHLKGEK